MRGNWHERDAGARQRGVDKLIATLPVGFTVARIIQLYHPDDLQSLRIADGKIDVLRCDGAASCAIKPQVSPLCPPLKNSPARIHQY